MAKTRDVLYFLFRIIVGGLFFCHGIQKLFGLWGFEAPPLLTLMGFAGILEFILGIMLIFGLFTRLAGVVGGLLMVFAYFIAHFGKAILPIVNGGELALLYLAAFLVLIGFGGKMWAVDNWIWGKS